MLGFFIWLLLATIRAAGIGFPGVLCRCDGWEGGNLGSRFLERHIRRSLLKIDAPSLPCNIGKLPRDLEKARRAGSGPASGAGGAGQRSRLSTERIRGWVMWETRSAAGGEGGGKSNKSFFLSLKNCP